MSMTLALPQDFGELVVKGSWLNQLEHIIVRHGILLLRWRSGGVKHPHDMPPFRFRRHQLQAIALAEGWASSQRNAFQLRLNGEGNRWR